MDTIVQGYRADTRIATRVVRDRQTGLPLIIKTQDTEPIVADARRMANNLDRHAQRRQRTHGAGFQQVASIPLIIWRQLQLAGISKDRKRLLAWLSQPECRLLRTDDGKRLA